MDNHSFTPTQQRLLAVLADGRPHQKGELLAMLDSLVGENTLSVHLCAMRKKLRPIGQDIICQYMERHYYFRQIRLLAHPD